MQVGIIGLPNVGKSTLFKILTKKQVEISNYPFCTIDPNVGVVKIPDKRLEKIARLAPSAQVVPAYIEFVDIAGLVRGAHEGEGLGNQFLAHIREVDAVIHVVRGFENSEIQNTEQGINPKRDIEIINTELALADLATIQKRIEKVKPQARAGDKDKIQELAFLEKLNKLLPKAQLIKNSKLAQEEQKILSDLFLLTAKPIIYLLNTDENKTISKSPPIDLALPLKLELEIESLASQEQTEYREAMGIPKTGINQLISLAFQKLKLITFYTLKGGKEVRAWPVLRGIQAPAAAGQVHSDFEKGFIKAEVISWSTLLQAGSWKKARAQGKIATKGRNYEISDGDVIEFKV